MFVAPVLGLALLLADLRSDLARGVGTVELPPGETHLERPLEIPPGAHDLTLEGSPRGSTLVLDGAFQGRAAIVVNQGTNVVLKGFSIRGNRTDLKSDWYLPEHYEPFADYYTGNGIVARKTDRLAVVGVKFSAIRAFPLIVNASSRVLIDAVEIRDCGTLNRAGRNNTTGGILLEQGVANFEIRNAAIARITGNAIWTHSYADAPRSSEGFIHNNTISWVGRDAIQIGHATRVRVADNSGSNIGFPAEYVDVEHSAVAVALDTAGNVDFSTYADNRFTDVNGQCIDLDGFHDGEVLTNSCVNAKPLAAYPALHSGIVFGNNNPDATSDRIVVQGNTLQGFAYGGIFLVGSNNRIERNRLSDLNRAHCGAAPVPAPCAYALDQPDMLRSGVYIANNGGRPAPASGNIIRDNTFSGFGIREHCIAAAPGVALSANTISGNLCSP